MWSRSPGASADAFSMEAGIESARTASLSRIGGAAVHLNDYLAKVIELGAGIRTSPRRECCSHGSTRRRSYATRGRGLLVPKISKGWCPRCCEQGHRQVFEDTHELDASYSAPNIGRFRVNVFRQKDSVGCVMRAIPFQIIPLKELGLPPIPSNPSRRNRVALCWSLGERDRGNPPRWHRSLT